MKNGPMGAVVRVLPNYDDYEANSNGWTDWQNHVLLEAGAQIKNWLFVNEPNY